jgi:uncharacterized membrane protein YqaE (UPF0057 family)
MPTIKPKRHHGFGVVLFILGTLFPPLGLSSQLIFPLPLLISRPSAVAARFGIGGDFWLNLLLTLAGYIPGSLSARPVSSDSHHMISIRTCSQLLHPEYSQQ